MPERTAGRPLQGSNPRGPCDLQAPRASRVRSYCLAQIAGPSGLSCYAPPAHQIVNRARRATIGALPSGRRRPRWPKGHQPPRPPGSGPDKAGALVTSTRSSKDSYSARLGRPHLVRRGQPERLQQLDQVLCRRRPSGRAMPWNRSQSGFRDVSGCRAVISTTHEPPGMARELGHERLEVRDVVEHVMTGHHVGRCRHRRRPRASDRRPSSTSCADPARAAAPSTREQLRIAVDGRDRLGRRATRAGRPRPRRRRRRAPCPESRAPRRPVRTTGLTAPLEPAARPCGQRADAGAPRAIRARRGKDLGGDGPGLEVGRSSGRRARRLSRRRSQTLKRISSTSPS